MGLQIKEIIKSAEISIETLAGRVLVVDSFNLLYQFLASVRQRDGTLLMDSRGDVTSHLSGLFSRTTKLMRKGIRLAFVFDGKSPGLKQQERARRAELKHDAERKYEIAAQREDIAGMRKYAARTARLTPEMVQEAKKLITALGCPVIQAPSEGEAQAAHIAKKENAFATVSQDFDTLLYGSPRLVRNLSLQGRRKRANKLSYDIVKPEMISLEENLNELSVDIDQLIVIAMLVGTDYNIGGIKGIGPKKALDLVREHGKDFDSIFAHVGWDNYFDFPWTDVYYLIKNMPVNDDYVLEWPDIDRKGVIDLMCTRHEFSRERIESTLDKFGKKDQKALGDFF